MKISICLAIRNGEKYMLYLDELFSKIENTYKDFIFEFFIYENNSTDNTKFLIEKFALNRNCKYLLEDIENNTMKSEINYQRGIHMSNIRNKLKDFHGILDSDYVLLFDCDVVFLPNTLEQLLNTINNTPDNIPNNKIVMVSPFCICYHYYIKNNKSIHYYDTLAVISNVNIAFNHTFNTCLFKKCIKCMNIRKKINRVINPKYLFDDDKLISVKSCFGSLSLIKTDVYNKVKWGNSICEHHSFCKQVNEYGDIVINPNIKTFTTIPTINDYNNIEKELEYIYILNKCI